MAAPELFVGITTWNSASFIDTTLTAVRRTTDAARTRLVVFDNVSTDDTVAIARKHKAEVFQRKSGQQAALMDLFNLSNSELTLLIHADVILLDERWLDVCRKHLTGNVALVSPEDIGCGPYTRPWGKNMPESSFMFFRTALARKTRTWHWRRRFRLRVPYRGLDFSGDHITYNLPPSLQSRGYSWVPMKVHTSPRLEKPMFVPAFTPPRWREELAMYRYGLGNFYSLDGVITHYHNWYERGLADVPEDSAEVLKPQAGSLPVAFLAKYSRAFLDDYARGAVAFPEL